MKLEVNHVLHSSTLGLGGCLSFPDASVPVWFITRPTYSRSAGTVSEPWGRFKILGVLSEHAEHLAAAEAHMPAMVWSGLT